MRSGVPCGSTHPLWDLGQVTQPPCVWTCSSVKQGSKLNSFIRSLWEWNELIHVKHLNSAWNINNLCVSLVIITKKKLKSPLIFSNKHLLCFEPFTNHFTCLVTFHVLTSWSAHPFFRGGWDRRSKHIAWGHTQLSRPRAKLLLLRAKQEVLEGT